MDLWDLGIFEHLVMFPVRRGLDPKGYGEVVAPWGNVAGARTLLSLYGPSPWSRAVRSWRSVHFFSPHFFHLVRYNPNATGMVHDMDYLDPLGGKAQAIGYPRYLARSMRFVTSLRGVAVPSRFTKRELESEFPRVTAQVVPHWTSYDFRPRDQAAARRQLGLPQDRVLLLSVGSDLVRKNLRILPDLLRALGPDYVLVRVGGSRALRSRVAPRSLIERTGVPAAEYPLYFNAADLLLMPSVREGFGVPVIEAINSELPVAASSIETFREVLGPEYPFFAGPSEPREWPEVCERILATRRDRSVRAPLFDRYRGRFRPERALADYLEFFRMSAEAS